MASSSFALTHLTDLLDSLESLHTQTPPLPPQTLTHKTHTLITSWFDFHHPILHNHPRTLAALYSLLLPHLRADRSYALREAALARIITRAQLLGATRAAALANWRASRDGDFAAVVARVLRQAENPLDRGITVEYVDSVLDRVAAKSRFSSDGLRAAMGEGEGEGEREGTRADILAALYRRLTSVQAKWVTRVILKCLAPVEMPGRSSLSFFFSCLPAAGLMIAAVSVKRVIHYRHTTSSCRTSSGSSRTSPKPAPSSARPSTASTRASRRSMSASPSYARWPHRS